MKTINPFDTRKEYTRIHNYTLDHIMPSLKPNEWKVLCFVIRKTEGWGKDAETLSYSEIKKGTGIKSDPTLSSAIKGLIVKNYVFKVAGDGQWDANTYQLNTALEVQIDGSPTIENTAGSTIKTKVSSTIENTAGSTIKTKDNIKDTVKDTVKERGDNDHDSNTPSPAVNKPQSPPPMATAADRGQFRRPEMQYLDGLKSQVKAQGLTMAQFVPMVNVILEKRGEAKLAQQAGKFGADALRNAQEAALSILQLDPARFGSAAGIESVFQSWEENDYRGKTTPSHAQLTNHANLVVNGREKENGSYQNGHQRRTNGPTFTEQDYESHEQPFTADQLAQLADIDF